MYRSILVGTFLSLLGLALAATALALVGAEAAQRELERTHLAQGVLEAHVRLEALTYSLFKQLTDAYLSDGANPVDEPAARARLNAQLDRTRGLIAAEVAAFGDREDETDELSRLAEIERQINRVLEQFRVTSAILARGGSIRDAPMLRDVLERTIDQEFRQLIEAAVAEERREVEAARRAADAVIGRMVGLATAAAAAAVLLCTGALVVLLRRLDRPIAALDEASQAVARGDLARRMPASGRDEFAGLGRSLNRMLDRLASERGAVDAARRALEAAVEARTQELEVANAALRRTDRMRRRFLADVSHELRTPLAIIRGEAEVTLRGRAAPPEDLRTALGRVAEQATGMGRLVDDLLFVARAEGGEPRLAQETVALGPILAQACDDLRGRAQAEGVALDLRDEGRGCLVRGDPGRLRQMALILLDNALRYSEPGGAVAASVSPSPRGVALRVADRGIGIPPEDLDRVFERFFRGANAAARDGEGSGLGLAMAKTIVEAHGGEIAVESRLGEGTTLTVTLPALGRMRAVA